MQYSTAVQSFVPVASGRYASFWRRAAAFVIDVVLVYASYIALLWVLYLAGVPEFPYLFGFWTVWWVYVVLLTSRGATVGKRAAGIVVIDEYGEQPDVVSAIKRALLAATLSILLAIVALDNGEVVQDENDSRPRMMFRVSVLSLILMAIGLVAILRVIRDERKQTLHDWIGGTFVVRKQASAPPAG
jgi:uncharacterized RDD family membrane protein YckC